MKWLKKIPWQVVFAVTFLLTYTALWWLVAKCATGNC